MDYELERSRRKTVAVIVRGGRVVVRAPLRLSVREIERFLMEKEAWIRRKLSENAAAQTLFSDITACRAVLYRGVKFPVCRNPDERTGIAGGVFFVPAEAHDDISTALAKWFRRTAKRELSERLAVTAAALGVTYSGFSVYGARTQWGNCSAAGAIRLNYRLIMLERPLAEYVIVHELCHLREMNHSRRFWHLVETALPDYRQRRAALKRYAALLRDIPY